MKVQEEPLFYKWLEVGTLKNKECTNCPAIGICGGACAYDVYIKTGQIGMEKIISALFKMKYLSSSSLS